MIKTITGSYTLDVDDSWRLGQLQEIYLQCDTTLAPVTIDLFEIVDLERFWNVKIFVTDVAQNAGTNNITINAFGSDIIDETGTSSLTISTDGASIELQVVGETQWLGSESNGGGGIPTLQQVLDFNHDLVDGNNFQGTFAGVGNTGTDVIALGTSSAYCNTSSQIVAVGTKSAFYNVGQNITASGSYSAYCNAGNSVTAIGTSSASYNTGNNVTALGLESAYCNTGGEVTASGYRSAYCNTGGKVTASGTSSYCIRL